MRLRKITVDSRPIFRKRRVKMQYQVSGWNDEFDCGGEAEFINKVQDLVKELDDLLSGKQDSPKFLQGSFGVSKKETLVSDHYALNGSRGLVDGSG